MLSTTANVSTPQVSDGYKQGWGANWMIRSAGQCTTHACAAITVPGLASGQGRRGTAVPSNRAMELGNARAHSIPAAQPGLLASMQRHAPATLAHDHDHELGTAGTTSARGMDGGRRPCPKEDADFTAEN